MNFEDFTFRCESIGGHFYAVIDWPGKSGIQSFIPLDNYYKNHKKLPSNDEIKELFIKDFKTL